MSGDLEELAARVERAAEAFGDRFAAVVELTSEKKLAAELSYQSRPLLQALLEGLHSSNDPAAPELREAFALCNLLGRRAAVLEASPTAAARIVPALLAAIETGDAIREPLREVLLEGYVAEREDRLRDAGALRAAAAIPVIRLAPGCFVTLPQGDQDADPLGEHGEELGRRLLDGDAKALVVYGRGLERPDPERATQLFAIQISCRMLGVRCIFAGIGEDWVRAARERGTELDDTERVGTLHEALELALTECGYALRPHASLGRFWRRLVGRS